MRGVDPGCRAWVDGSPLGPRAWVTLGLPGEGRLPAEAPTRVAARVSDTGIWIVLEASWLLWVLDTWDLQRQGCAQGSPETPVSEEGPLHWLSQHRGQKGQSKPRRHRGHRRGRCPTRGIVRAAPRHHRKGALPFHPVSLSLCLSLIHSLQSLDCKQIRGYLLGTSALTSPILRGRAAPWDRGAVGPVRSRTRAVGTDTAAPAGPRARGPAPSARRGLAAQGTSLGYKQLEFAVQGGGDELWRRRDA